VEHDPQARRVSGDYARLGHPTRPLPRATAEERANEVTKVKCPMCAGCGMVPPEVAMTAEHALAMMKEQA
jgi:hypothetical protein